MPDDLPIRSNADDISAALQPSRKPRKLDDKSVRPESEVRGDPESSGEDQALDQKRSENDEKYARLSN